MNIDEYNAEQQGLVAALIQLIFALFRPFKAQEISRQTWGELLTILYPDVEQLRQQSAENGRRLYDSERTKYVGSVKPAFRVSYDPQWFAEAMEPARQAISQPGAGDDAISEVVLRAAKEVENGGRRQVIMAVNDDPIVQGWARVATGRETCAFCLMLVSRGPVYTGAEEAGLNLNDTSAADLWKKADAGDIRSQQVMDELMTRWHPGCDCKVVPVFKRASWPGIDAFHRAESAWANYTAGYGGLDALNALRRAVDNGLVDFRDFAVAA